MGENPTFGFKPDKDGMINFMTVQSEYVPICFAEYMEFFQALVQVALDNEGYMPIVTFPRYEKPQ